MVNAFIDKQTCLEVHSRSLGERAQGKGDGGEKNDASHTLPGAIVPLRS